MKKRKLYFGIDPDSDTHEKGSGMCIGEIDPMGNTSITFSRIEIFDFVKYVNQYVGVPNQTDSHIIVECHGIVGGDGKLHSNTDVLHSAMRMFERTKKQIRAVTPKKTAGAINAVSRASVNVGRNAQLGYEFQKACVKYGFNYSPILNQQRQHFYPEMGDEIKAIERSIEEQWKGGGKVFDKKEATDKAKLKIHHEYAKAYIADTTSFLGSGKNFMPTKIPNDVVQLTCKELGFAPNKKTTNDDERSAFGLILPHLIKSIN